MFNTCHNCKFGSVLVNYTIGNKIYIPTFSVFIKGGEYRVVQTNKTAIIDVKKNAVICTIDKVDLYPDTVEVFVNKILKMDAFV